MRLNTLRTNETIYVHLIRSYQFSTLELCFVRHEYKMPRYEENDYCAGGGSRNDSKQKKKQKKSSQNK